MDEKKTVLFSDLVRPHGDHSVHGLHGVSLNMVNNTTDTIRVTVERIHTCVHDALKANTTMRCRNLLFHCIPPTVDLVCAVCGDKSVIPCFNKEVR